MAFQLMVLIIVLSFSQKMSPEVVKSMVKAANVGGNVDRLLKHELYYRTKGKQGERLHKVS